MWIAPEDVTAVYPSDDPTPEFIEHVQGLAEAVIGEQDEPVGRPLKSVLVDISHRMWVAIHDDPNVTQESLGGWSQARRAGLGLTDREKSALREAVGSTGLWVQPTTRNETLETELVPFTIDQELDRAWKAWT